MSQRQFPVRRPSDRPKEEPHSQKSADSAKESLARKKEEEWLENKLKDLRRRSDMAKQRSDKYWKQAKQYEASERMDLALEAKTMCEMEASDYKKYNRQIRKCQERLFQLSIVRLHMGENYATMKMEEPPSDNED